MTGTWHEPDGELVAQPVGELPTSSHFPPHGDSGGVCSVPADGQKSQCLV